MRYFLEDGAVLRWLETPAVYHIRKDELYELDTEAFEFLEACASGDGCEAVGSGFIGACLEEGILSEEPVRKARPLVARSPVPSLRYLELQITDKCNLRCGHCYINHTLQGGSGLSVDRVRSVLKEFEDMQGLRVLITGGEPLMHDGFDAINAMLPEFSLRKVLFTNGLLLTGERAAGLNFDEVQISIDGMEKAHDILRGRGSFSKALEAARLCMEKGLDVSISTMVHAKNLADFDAMDGLFREMGVKDWTVDVPCSVGRMKENGPLQVSPEEGGRYLGYGFGGGIHESAPGFGCGLHLMAVSADGRVSKCTFYSDAPAGRVEEGLKECWKRILPVRLADLACDCAHVGECRGGCRYRAGQCGDASGRDLYRCFYYDIM